MGGAACDKCNQQIIVQKGFYHCDYCGEDICDACDFEKENKEWVEVERPAEVPNEDESKPPVSAWRCPVCGIPNDLANTFEIGGDCINKANFSGKCHFNTEEN